MLLLLLLVILLDGNEIDTIPREIGTLEHLQVLTMNDNKLLFLPTELVNCEHLRILSVLDNLKVTVAPVKLVMSPVMEEFHCSRFLDVVLYIYIYMCV
jgi:Leucine-rich repeat (LRR) protein